MNKEIIKSKIIDTILSLDFKKTNENGIFYRRENKNYWSLFSIGYENEKFNLRYGVRPEEDFKLLGNILNDEFPPFVRNPFFEKWCSLIWVPITMNFSDIEDEPLDDLLIFIKREISCIRLSINEESISEWTRISWRTKWYDGLSRYTQVFMLMKCGEISTAAQSMKYFSMMYSPDNIDKYIRKISNIVAYFDYELDDVINSL